MDQSNAMVFDEFPELLALAASACTRLHTLELTCNSVDCRCEGRKLQGLGALSQLQSLKYLSLRNWSFPLGGGLAVIQQLSRLSSVEVTTHILNHWRKL